MQEALQDGAAVAEDAGVVHAFGAGVAGDEGTAVGQEGPGFGDAGGVHAVEGVLGLRGWGLGLGGCHGDGWVGGPENLLWLVVWG